jgi:hypothetical protein
VSSLNTQLLLRKSKRSIWFEATCCFEALRNITIYHPNLIPGNLIFCIDNSSTIDALDDPSTEHQHARQANQEATTLSLAGWTINTTWTPSHFNIPGNEATGQAAKYRETDTIITYPHAVTTKPWMKAECKRLSTKLGKQNFRTHNHQCNFQQTSPVINGRKLEHWLEYSVEGVLQIVAHTNHPQCEQWTLPNTYPRFKRARKQLGKALDIAITPQICLGHTTSLKPVSTSFDRPA